MQSNIPIKLFLLQLWYCLAKRLVKIYIGADADTVVIFFLYCRLPGLRMAINVLLILLIMCLFGLAATGYTKYTGRTIDVEFYKEKAIEYTQPAVDRFNSSYNHLTKTLRPHLTTVKNEISDFLQHAKTVTTDFISSLKSQYFSSYPQRPAQTKNDL